MRWAAAAAALVGAVWAEPAKHGALGPESTRLVPLNVVAEDGHGQPVRDLWQGDFAVFDGGKAQKIVLFREAGGQAAEAAPKLGPGEFSNRTAAALPRVTVVLFDLLNASPGEQSVGRGELLEALRKLDSAQYLYVYVLTLKGLLPIAPLPGRGDAPGRRGGTRGTAGIQEELDAASRTEYATRDYLFPEDREKATFDALYLYAMAARIGGVAGRKNLVWLTHGVPIQLDPGQTEAGHYGIDYTQGLRQLSAALDAEGISMYLVKLRAQG